jgi:hypothetical protein
MKIDARIATNLELKHFNELIAMLDKRSNGAQDIPRHTSPNLARHVVRELQRFGYIANPSGLLVRIDDGCHEPALNPLQAKAVRHDLYYLYARLGFDMVWPICNKGLALRL